MQGDQVKFRKIPNISQKISQTTALAKKPNTKYWNFCRFKLQIS